MPFGAAASPFNALEHGVDAVSQIVFTESAADLAELSAEYHQLYSPANSADRFLVDTLINNEWRRRRLCCVEADLQVAATNLSGEACVKATGPIRRLQRVVNSYKRNYRHALEELQRLQVGQAQGMPIPQPEQSKSTSTFSASFSDHSQTLSAAAPKPAHAPLSAGPEPVASPAETQPSASDRDPNPPGLA
jgi:hypothetical protein